MQSRWSSCAWLWMCAALGCNESASLVAPGTAAGGGAGELAAAGLAGAGQAGSSVAQGSGGKVAPAAGAPAAGAPAAGAPAPPAMAAAGASSAAGMLDAGDDAGADEPIDAGDVACSDCCADGYARGSAGTATRVIEHFTPSPADVTACAGGDAFLTLDGRDEIWRVPSSGPAVLHAAVSGVQPAGIACDERGRLFVAAFALRTGSAYSAPGVLLVEKAGATPKALPQPTAALPFGTPNGVAFAPGHGVYVTDTLGGVIVRVFEDAAGKWQSSVVSRNLLGVNGIAYDPAAHKLYVSNSLSREVSVFAVDAQGALGSRSVIWTGESGLLDGLAVDERGQVYVANYEKGPVLRIPEGEVVAMVTNPASLAFRGGTLLVVDYHLNQPALEGGLFASELGVCGAALFEPRR